MAVQPARLGKHGVLVSKLCLGTMNFGWHTSEEESFAIMDRALELGIRPGQRALADQDGPPGASPPFRPAL